jgi:hypothetical protein
MHALVQNLVALVPPEGSSWPRPSRQRWLAALAAVLDVLYEDEALDSPTRTAPVLAPPLEPPGRGTAAGRPSPFVDGPRPVAPGSAPPTADAGAADPVAPGHASVVDIRTEGQRVGTHRAKHLRPEP